MTSHQYDDVFVSGTPQWFEDFDRDAVDAVGRLLSGSYYLGPLNAAEPDELLVEWASALDDEFAARLDRALSGWVLAHWDADDRLLSLPDHTWQRVLRTVALLDEPPRETLGHLRAASGDAPARLGVMTSHQALDPLGWYWAAIGRDQPDDGLVDRWFDLCNIVPGTPVFHGRYGLLGLRRVPGPDLGGFRASVAAGALRYFVALAVAVEQRRIRQRDAERLATVEGRTLARAYPFPARWRTFWQEHDDLAELPRRWVNRSFGERTLGSRHGPAAPRPRRARRLGVGWADRSTAIAERLRAGSGLDEAEALLHEQREASRSNGTYNLLVRSLCRFSSSVQRHRADLALQWADEARALEPWNAYAWTTSMRSAAASGDLARAVLLGFASVDRFPDDVVAQNGLADVLKVAGRLGEAEVVYRSAVERFPDNVFAQNGLADVLKRAGRLDEAEVVYRSAVERFPDDVFGQNGLADVLKVAGRLGEAEAVYRSAAERFPDNVVPQNGLADVLKVAGRLGEAEAVYRSAVERFPDNVVAQTGLADVLKVAGRLGEAEAVYRSAMDRFPDNVFAQTGLADVLKVAGRLDEAEAVYRSAVERFPDNVVPQNGLADVLKRAGRLDEAEVVYRSAVERFPDDVFAQTGLADVLKVAGRLGEAEVVYPAATGPVVGDVVSLPGDVFRSTGRPDEGNGARPDSGAPREGTPPPQGVIDADELRARLRCALVLREEGPRNEALRDVVTLAREGRRPLDPHGLYTQIQALVALRRFDDVEAVLRDLPGYLANRAEFLALRGVTRSASVRTASRPFDASLVDEIAALLERAAQQIRPLRAMPEVTRLRVSAAMYDGAELAEARQVYVRDMKAALARERERDAAGGRRDAAALAGWWSRLVEQVLGLSGDAPTFGELQPELEARADLLDELENDLVSAARYDNTPP